jgi:hypothetical protein
LDDLSKTEQLFNELNQKLVITYSLMFSYGNLSPKELGQLFVLLSNNPLVLNKEQIGKQPDFTNKEGLFLQK